MTTIKNSTQKEVPVKTFTEVPESNLIERLEYLGQIISCYGFDSPRKYEARINIDAARMIRDLLDRGYDISNRTFLYKAYKEVQRLRKQRPMPYMAVIIDAHMEKFRLQFPEAFPGYVPPVEKVVPLEKPQLDAFDDELASHSFTPFQAAIIKEQRGIAKSLKTIADYFEYRLKALK